MIRSVFTHDERVSEHQCYRVSVLLPSFGKYQKKKKTKKTQNNVRRANAGVTPPPYEIESVDTSPIELFYNNIDSPENQRTLKSGSKVIFDLCNCKDNLANEKYSPKTWESITKMYRDIDTTQIWVEPDDLIKNNVYGRRRKNRNAENIAFDQLKDGRKKRKKKHKKKSATRKNKIDRNAKKQHSLNRKGRQENEVGDNPYDDSNHESVVSLYRNINKNRKSPKAKLKFEKISKFKRKDINSTCKCDKEHHDDGLNMYKLHCYNENCQFQNKPEVSKKIKHDKTIEKILHTGANVIKKECLEGPCVDAVKKKNKHFLCKCIKRRTEPEFPATECTNATCKKPTESLSVNSVVKMKEKILCLCHKYSQKIVNKRHTASNVCKEGLCSEALKRDKPNFICKCNKEQPLKECSDDTCSKYTKNKTAIKNAEKIICKCFSTKSGLLKYMFKQQKKVGHPIKMVEHASEQTGEPFFEVKVNPFDMCVLNPTEIKEKIMKYGTIETNKPDCSCSSRKHLRAEEICKRGVCHRALRNKQTNFDCKCEKKLAECEDTTCDINNRGDVLKNGTNRKQLHHLRKTVRDKPLFEVQLDKDKMCVLNSQEIENKIINNRTVNEICSSGVCRAAALKHNIPFYCKCVGRKMNPDVTECSEETCTEKKKSKFALFCTRICSKSENWTSKNNIRRRKRVTRQSYYDIGPKLCRGKICTKSDNFHDRHGVNLDESIRHLPSCQCQECKNNIKSSHGKPKAKVYSNMKKNKEVPQSSNIDNNKITRPHETEKDIRLNKRRRKRIRHPRKIPPRKIHSTKIKKDHHYQSIKNPETEKELEKVVCTCAHACECNINDLKSETKKFKDKEKLERKKKKQKTRNKKIDQRNFTKDMKRRAKLDKKKEKKAAKERRREIRMMQKKMKEEPLDTNCFMAFLLGILKTGVKAALFIFSIIISVITDPKGSFWYVSDRIKDPKGTYNKIMKWFSDALMLKKLQISETIRGSETMTILADHFQDSAFYQSVADKGRTKKDQMLFEQKSKARKRRIRKRQEQAIFSCRHMLLTTLRQTPCLWVYHICPNFYPQCLGLLTFMRSFSHILLFLGAFACWTPCIVSFELCRAVMCCFMCTH